MHEKDNCRRLKWIFDESLIVGSSVLINYTIQHENISAVLACAQQFVHQLVHGDLVYEVSMGLVVSATISVYEF